MIEKCLVKVISNKVICDNKIDLKKHEEVKKSNFSEIIKNKKKLNHLESIGMDLNNYHPTIVKAMIDAGRLVKIPENLKQQLISFAKEAHEKGFNPALFGANTTLHKFIKTVHNIPKRPYKRKGGKIKPIESSSDESSSEEIDETDMDDVLSEVEKDIRVGNINKAKKNLKQHKHKIPKEYYSKIMKNIE